ncbi:uncharacterized protein [Diadema setosum]|uniref:uncharacterized protein n=1 Tax=Diadema setosum TaxID=31175 RepID=UPI003B3A4456
MATCCALISAQTRTWNVTDLGWFGIRNPAFTAIEPRPGGQGGYDLSISTFSAVPETLDSNFIVRDIGRQLQEKNIRDFDVEELPGRVLWPNEINLVPEDVFGISGIRWSATGFLLQSKRRGNVLLIDDSQNGGGKYYDITTWKCDIGVWFYHRVAWVDVNGDGRKDAITGRARFDFTYGLQKAEMVWLEHPEDPFNGEPWNIHYMYDGPDAFFTLTNLTTPDGTFEAIITPAYFTQVLIVHWIEGDTTDWSQPDKIYSRVIDSVEGESYFDAYVADVNRDGRRDLLVTASSEVNGKLLAFEIPDDFRTENWTRHQIADGFVPIISREGQGSPGIVLPVHPTTTDTDGKPLLMVTGDDDGKIYIFESEDYNDVNNWDYTRNVIFESRGTVGAMSVQDVDNDGYNEVFIPAYSRSRFHIMTFKPEEN